MSLGFTTYKAIDPIVLLLTTSYHFNVKHNNKVVIYNPGDYLLVYPSVAFAVNDRVSLTGGFKWLNRKSDIINNIKQGIRTTRTSLILVFNFGLLNGDSIDLALKANCSGQKEVALILGWTYNI